MIRWMNRVPLAAETALLLGVGLPLLLTVVVYPVIRLMCWLDGAGQWEDPYPRTITFGLFTLTVSALAYGALRVWHTHPQTNEDLRKMLAASPWGWPRPLPFGPVRLTLQDAIAVITSTWWANLLLGSAWPSVVFVVAMLIAYCWMVASVCSATEVPAAAAGIALCGAGMVAFALTPWLSGLFLLIAVAIAWWGIGRSLRRFHLWSGQLDDGRRIPEGWTWSGGSKSKHSLGWPHGVLNPIRRGPVVPIGSAAQRCLLLGCWMWAACHLAVTVEAVLPRTEYDFSGFDFRPWYLLPIAVGGVAALLRLTAYLEAVRAPLSLWGRIWNRRYMLPGYDEVVLVPLLLAALGPAMSMVGLRLAVPLEWFLPVSTTTLLLLATGIGPSLEKWQLTSRAHLRQPTSGREKLMQTQ
jgi:hypothetical protein